jgi:nucleoside-diphosphate-sugar epimerase
MNDILVLGGTQFFGKRLVEKLLTEGKKVTIATRGLTKDPFGDKVKRLIIDRENMKSQLDAFSGRKWDVVYDQSCFSPQELKATAEALDGKVAHYIFTSSMAVYNFGKLHKEDDFKPEQFFLHINQEMHIKGMKDIRKPSVLQKQYYLITQGFNQLQQDFQS